MCDTDVELLSALVRGNDNKDADKKAKKDGKKDKLKVHARDAARM